MSDPSLDDFLRRALVWPDPDSDLGWVNLHWRPQNHKGIVGGQAFKTVDEIEGFINWTQNKGKAHVSDLYFCTSLQEEHGPAKKSGKYAAERSADNARSSRILFADVDKYETKPAALAAVLAFCEQSQSPLPSAVVDSGGGIHAYWFLPEPLLKEAWLDLAYKFDGLMNQYGLKHDHISTDIARILRVPGTVNYKKAEQGLLRPVKILNLDKHPVDLANWKSLQEAQPTPALIHAKRGNLPGLDVAQLFVDPNMARQGPAPRFRGKVSPQEQLGEGTLDAEPITTWCPMFNDALVTGGVDVAQPVWHQQALACTFIFQGREFFHDLGRQHPAYSPADTDAMYDRKLRDRVRIGLGYPSCATFEAAGAPQCRTCPLRNAISSPLKIDRAFVKAKDKPVLVVEDGDLVAGDAQAEEIKQAVYRDIHAEIVNKFAAMADREGIIKDVEDDRMPLDEALLPKDIGYYVYGDPEEGESPSCIYHSDPGGKGRAASRTQLLASQIYAVEIFKDGKNNGLGLRVRCSSDKGVTVAIEISNAAFATAEQVYARLNEGGAVTMGNAHKVYNLMLSFRGRMAMESRANRTVGLGWTYPEQQEGGPDEQGVPNGFAYDGTVYMPFGKTRPAYGLDSELRKTFSVRGNVEPWLSAMKQVMKMKSPGLETIILTAFAAPLMIFTGQPSAVIMVRGPSGGSKSTASAISCAVWARPRTGMIKPASSKLALMRRMGQLRHLPSIWDDIRNNIFEVVRDTLMEITQGGDGLKLDQQRNEREQGIWDNLLLTSSNNSLVEYLEEVSKNDGAALVRCFEFSVPKILVGDPAYVDPNYLAPLIADLDFNHGWLGREYAKELGGNPNEIKEFYKKNNEGFAQLVAPYQPYERFWMAAASTILTAAFLVNDMPIMKGNGVQFDVYRLRDFLLKTFLDLRERHAAANVHADTSSYVKNYLSQYINHHAARYEEIVWTLDAPAGRGKPAKTAPLWPVGDRALRQKAVSVRWVVSERKVRISKNSLEGYLRKEKVSVDRMKEGLERFYEAKLTRGRIAAGLPNIAAQGTEYFYEIEVKPGTWLDKMLQQHSTPDDAQEIALRQPAQSPDQPELHPQPEHEAQEDGLDAS